jgi:hypothetical protein
VLAHFQSTDRVKLVPVHEFGPGFYSPTGGQDINVERWRLEQAGAAEYIGRYHPLEQTA